MGGVRSVRGHDGVVDQALELPVCAQATAVLGEVDLGQAQVELGTQEAPAVGWVGLEESVDPGTNVGFGDR